MHHSLSLVYTIHGTMLSARFYCLIFSVFLFIILIIIYLSYSQPNIWHQTPYQPLHETSRHPAVAVLKRYDSRMVLPLVVREQMTMAISNLYDLAWFATEPSWNANIVLPVIWGNHSRLVGIPPTANTTHPLSAIYNVSMWQQNLYNKFHIRLPLIEFEKFMKYTDRNNIRYFHLLPTFPNSTHPIFEKCNKSVELSFHAAIDSLNVEALKRNLPGFELSNAHCLVINVGNKQTLPEDFITRSGLKGLNTFTIVLNIWTGILMQKLVKSFSYKVVVSVPLTKMYHIHRTRQLLPPYSNDIEEITIKYLKNLTRDIPFIGVHIRAERMRNDRSEQCIQDCIIRAQKISKSNHYNMTLYFGDHIVKNYKHVLSELGVSMSHFDPSLYNAIQNNGLISQIEQNVLSHAETLVVCGGGSFQNSVVKRFKNRKPKGSVNYICSSFFFDRFIFNA